MIHTHILRTLCYDLESSFDSKSVEMSQTNTDTLDEWQDSIFMRCGILTEIGLPACKNYFRLTEKQGEIEWYCFSIICEVLSNFDRSIRSRV